MIDLKQIFPLKSAKLGIVMTILVFTSACAHEVLVTPSNNDGGKEELGQVVPEPETPRVASQLTETKQAPAKTKKAHSGKRIAKHKHKAKKSGLIAKHKVKSHKAKQVVTSVASVKELPPPPAPPAPQIEMPSAPAPLASAAVQTEIVEEGSHIGVFFLYGLGALAILALVYLAPRARRLKGPKRKLVYNG